MYYVYILANEDNSMVYVGVTNDIKLRLYEHRNGQIEGFTKKYHVNKLVYYEEYSEITFAISREKQMKHWVRRKKNRLVETINPEWKDFGAAF